MLTTSMYNTNAMNRKLEALDKPKIITEALKLLGAVVYPFHCTENTTKTNSNVQ